MKKDIFSFLCSFLASLLSAIFVYYLFKNMIITCATTVSVFIILLGAFLYIKCNKYFLKHDSLNTELIKKIDKIGNCIDCCDLNIAGLSQIFENAEITLDQTLHSVVKNYRFLGVSAEKVITNTTNFKQIVESKAFKNATFEFILLNYKATDTIRKHAEREGEDPKALAKRLESFIIDLANMKKKFEKRINVYLYDTIPIFRLVFVDDAKCFVSFYGAENQKGVTVPQLVFQKTVKSYYTAFEGFYSFIKNSSKLISD